MTADVQLGYGKRDDIPGVVRSPLRKNIIPSLFVIWAGGLEVSLQNEVGVFLMMKQMESIPGYCMALANFPDDASVRIQDWRNIDVPIDELLTDRQHWRGCYRREEHEKQGIEKRHQVHYGTRLGSRQAQMARSFVFIYVGGRVITHRISRSHK